LGELWGKLANSRQQPGWPNPIFQNAGQSKQLITANDLQNWSVALGAKADSVPKTKHKLQESGIIASRHGQTVSNKLTAGNLKQKEVVNQRNFIRHQPRKQENFRFPKDSENCSCDLTIWPILESLFVLVPTLLLTQHSNKTR